MKVSTCFLSLVLAVVPLGCWAASGDSPGFYVVHVSAPGVVDTFVGEITNLGSESEVIEQQITDESGQRITRKMPGRVKWLDITLKRGLTSSLDLANWRRLVTDGYMTSARKNVTIILYDAAQTRVAQWQLQNAWPSMITLEQRADGTFVEVLRLVHEGLVRERI
ncbi:MAG TPA: phage tail protein [Methylomirabilota bacterium]|nr:phage tail protein [Methylomirabilota bacterium]